MKNSGRPSWRNKDIALDIVVSNLRESARVLDRTGGQRGLKQPHCQRHLPSHRAYTGSAQADNSSTGIVRFYTNDSNDNHHRNNIDIGNRLAKEVSVLQLRPRHLFVLTGRRSQDRIRPTNFAVVCYVPKRAA